MTVSTEDITDDGKKIPEMIPAKYNTDSQLGLELAIDAGRDAEVVTIQLRSE